jgi:hypothetical protein
MVKPLLHELSNLHVSLEHLISTRIGVTLTAVRKALPEENNPIFKHASARTLAARIIAKWKTLLPKSEFDKPTAEPAKKATKSTVKTQSSATPRSHNKSTVKAQSSLKRPRQTESETEQSSSSDAKHKHKSNVSEKEKDEDLEKLQSKYGMGPSTPSVTSKASALQPKKGLPQPPTVITKPSPASATKPSSTKVMEDRLARLEAAENRRNSRKRAEGVQAVVKAKGKVANLKSPGSNVFGATDVDLEEEEVGDDAIMPPGELEAAINERECELRSCREQIKALVKNVNPVEHRQLSRDIQWSVTECHHAPFPCIKSLRFFKNVSVYAGTLKRSAT